MEIQKKSCCRICGSKKLEKVLLFKDMPLTDQFVKAADFGKEFLHDIKIAICQECGITQNLTNLNLDKYYDDYRYRVDISGFAKQFMRKLAEKIKEHYFPHNPVSLVLEIGSGTGEQLKEFQKLGFKTLGIEPSKHLVNLANKKGLKTIRAFFDADIQNRIPKSSQKFDLITSSYTFDHLSWPNEAIKVIWKLLRDQGLLVLEVHDLDLIIKRGEFCLFEHEHLTYFNQRTISKFLSDNGFRVLSFDLLKDYEKRANSLLVVAQKIKEKDNFKISVKQEVLKLKNLEQKVFKTIKKIDNWLKNHKDKKIVGYGAGGRGVMTLAALKNFRYIAFVVDKNPKGKNLYLPKSHLPLFALDKLRKTKTDIIIVFSFGYYEEIVKELSLKYGYKKEQLVSLLEIIAG